jgi:hypothetical protein
MKGRRANTPVCSFTMNTEEYENDDLFWSSVIEDAIWRDDVETYKVARDKLIRINPLLLQPRYLCDKLIKNRSIQCLKELIEFSEMDTVYIPTTYLFILGRAVYENDPHFIKRILDEINTKICLSAEIGYFRGMRYNESMGVLFGHSKMGGILYKEHKKDIWIQELFRAHKRARRGILLYFR